MAQSTAMVRTLGRVLASGDPPRSVLLALVIPHQYAVDGHSARRWAVNASLNSMHAVASSSPSDALGGAGRTLTLMPLVASPEVVHGALAMRGVVGVDYGLAAGSSHGSTAPSCVGLIEDAFDGACRGASGRFAVRLGLCLPQSSLQHPATVSAGRDVSACDASVEAVRTAVASHDMVVFASGMELWGSSTGSGVGEDAIRSVLASVVGPEGFGRGLADALLREGAAAGVVSADLIESESEKPASAEPGGSPASASSAAAEATSRGSMPVMPDAVSLDSMPAALVGSVAHVVIGGTFDRLHAGHWKLISAAALLAREKLTIGVTSDVMVSAKKGADQIAPQSKRAAMAQAVAEACAPGIRVECPIIEDPMGPSVTDASMGAIVVSSETAAGAGIINRARWEAGLGLLLPYSVHRGTAAGLSSTALREQDAKAT